uniref:Uncharacterized protein n=1 Tax=Rhizophagus irregularis (strain DAOM 181602 / DAOM 197198 / MUCL 43194) TaxID=747089 RepID=U9U2C6_RHIID
MFYLLPSPFLSSLLQLLDSYKENIASKYLYILYAYSFLKLPLNTLHLVGTIKD